MYIFKRLFLAILLVGSMIWATAAFAFEYHSVGNGEIHRIAKASGVEINSYFSGNSFVMSTRLGGPAFPFYSRTFFYFKPNGDLFYWNDTVFGKGRWEAGWLGNNETLLCMRDAGAPDSRPCLVLDSIGFLVIEKAEGDVLGLADGRPPEVRLMEHTTNFRRAQEFE